MSRDVERSWKSWKMVGCQNTDFKPLKFRMTHLPNRVSQTLKPVDGSDHLYIFCCKTVVNSYATDHRL